MQLSSNETPEQTKKRLLDRLNKIRNDPIEFLKGVYTLDESDKKNPIKRFPVDLEYIQLYVKVWLKRPKLVVPKSRRMKMSWINIALYTWDTMFHTGRHNAFVSKKEEAADFLIKDRAKFIIDNLDNEIIPKAILPKYTYKYCMLEFPEIHSKIQGFPQGADQTRQYTLSGMLADEFAFWEKAEDTYSAAKPTLEGGGRFTGISSPAPGFFKRLVVDKLNSIDFKEIQKAVDTAPRKYPMEGVEIWTNKQNRFTVFQLHYTADPAKRSKEWRDTEKSGLPTAKWNQEYELKWDSYSGVPVYPDYDAKIHGSKYEIKPWIGLPLIRGWDFALKPACVVCQLQEDKLVVLREFVAENMGADRFSDMVIPQLKVFYPQWINQKEDYIDFVDPSGFVRKDTDETTCASILASKGINPRPGAVTWEERRTSVEHYLTKVRHGGACFTVNLIECPVLAAGFEGGYRYADTVLELESNKIRPLKDEHSHPHDGLQMITSRIKAMPKKKKRKIPPQRYYNH